MKIDPTKPRLLRSGQPRPWRSGSWRGALPLLALLLQSCGAGDPPVASSGWSLLERSPDARTYQPGVLVPGEATQWGSLGLVGWDTVTQDRDGTPYVWSRATTGRLELPAGTPRDRTLALTLWCPPAPRDAQVAVVRLNGVVVARTAICSEPETRRIDAPAPLWREGDNSLEIEVEEAREVPADAPIRILSSAETYPMAGPALARVEYDVERVPVVEPAHARLELPEGTAVVYDVQQIVPFDLQLSARPSGPGVMSLEAARLDADTGEVLEELRRFDIDVTTAGIDRRFPIGARAGDLVRLRVSWHSEGEAALRLERLDVLDREPVDRFPIVLIGIDTLTAEHLSAYGYARKTSPRLDELARDSVVFERCVSNATWTLPSFLSLMTGEFAGAHFVRDSKVEGGAAELWENWTLAENRWTLAEALRASGWRTAGVVDNFWLGNRFQFTQGFDFYDMSADAIPKEDPDGGIRRVSRVALDWLDGDGTVPADRDPFFLFLHCFDVHGPYSVDEPFQGRFDHDELWETEHSRYAGAVGSTFGAIHEYITAAEYAPGETPRELATGPIVAKYDEGVALADDGVGTFLDGLRARGLYDDALIIVFADHGETMGEGDIPFAHAVLDEIAIHVPLIVKLPGNAHRGQRVGERVQLVDVYPTVLDLIGLHPDREMLHGRSLVPLLEGGTLPDVPTLTEGGIVAQSAVHFGEWKLVLKAPARDSGDPALLTYPDLPKEWVRERFPELLEGPLTAKLLASYREREDFEETLRKLRLKLNTYVDIGLYRPSEDPEERHDLRADHPEKLREMGAIWVELMAKRDEARRVAKLPTATVKPSEEDLATLRSLGYAGE